MDYSYIKTIGNRADVVLEIRKACKAILQKAIDDGEIMTCDKEELVNSTMCFQWKSLRVFDLEILSDPSTRRRLSFELVEWVVETIKTECKGKKIAFDDDSLKCCEDKNTECNASDFWLHVHYFVDGNDNEVR